MKLKKLIKNDRKISFLALTIVIIGSLVITYYKSYSYFKSEKSYNVIQGKIPEFTTGDIEISYTIDGEKASSFPKTTNYAVTVDCGDTATAEWDYNKWALFISNATKEQVRCNISFKTTLANYITTLASTDTTNLVYDETDDNNLRYIGADPDNYLCFDEDCSNGKWRVIGVMNNMQTETNGPKSLVKIIRADSVGKYAYDTSTNADYSSDNAYGYNDWTIAELQINLNSGDLYETYIKTYDSLFESVKWNLGGYSSSDITSSQYYTYERGTKIYSSNNFTRTTEWMGKIALMYPSDYGYATSGGDTTRDVCLSYSLSTWNSYSDCYYNDYIYDSSSYPQWTLTPLSNAPSGIYPLLSGGSIIFYGQTTCSSSLYVKPVGYLVSSASILSGTGSSNDPWIISK
jgi:hypothetical protein